MTRRLLIIVAAAAFGLVGAAPALATQPYHLNFKNFALDASDSTRDGTVLYNGTSLRLASSGLGSMDYTDPFADYSGDGADGSGAYEFGTWTSAPTTLSFPWNELVASWNADTPPGTWIQVEVKPTLDNGHEAKWYILGKWAYRNDMDFHPTSVGGQGDRDGYVAIDTWFAKDHDARSYRLRVTLFRRAGTEATPTLTRLSAIASNYRNPKGSFPSESTIGAEVDLGVPQYSQEIHHGDFPQYDNGGEAWCSPTSTSMVVSYWSSVTGTNYDPIQSEYQWVLDALGGDHNDPWVDYTARYVYDYHYNGAGNWPFNAAYAAGRGLVGDVTMLHNLREAEPFIEDGIPLVASVAWNPNKLDGSDIKSTNGHLLVIRGFTADGQQVIANDPASPTDDDVLHYYNREQFERAWVPASGGIVYVIRPVGWPTPDLTADNS
jgi:hypothetical protein